MRIVEHHEPGDFCWVELATTDTDAAQAFYRGLFGWEIHASSMGPDAFYYMPRLNSRDVAGIYKLTAEQAGVPPHWMLYVATDSADATAAKAKQLGAACLVEPMDIMDVGRMTVFSDPTGATLSAFQPNRHIGTGIAEAPGTMAWGELATADTAKAAAFYTQLFGWRTKSDPKTGYTEWLNGEKAVGGMMRMEQAPPHWTPYFSVTDCDAAVSRARELGGSVCVPATDIPDVGRFAILADAQGASFAVIALTGQVE
jgi:predicted enzyme related to lactoylglutathione lyase